MTTIWVLGTMKINMDMFRYFMLVTFPFLEWLCDSHYDIAKLKKMFLEQMDSEEFLFSNMFFYQKILRGAIELVAEHKSTLIDKLTDKMEQAGETMKGGDYLSTCNYLKKAMEKISYLSKEFEDYNLYVQRVGPSEICLRKVRPRMFRIENKEEGTYKLVRDLMRSTVRIEILDD